MRRLAGGDLSVDVVGRDRGDEVGGMAQAGVQGRHDPRPSAREGETALARAGAEAQRKATMRAMADRFEAAVSGVVGAVAAASSQLQGTASGMDVSERSSELRVEVERFLATVRAV